MNSAQKKYRKFDGNLCLIFQNETYDGNHGGLIKPWFFLFG